MKSMLDWTREIANNFNKDKNKKTELPHGIWEDTESGDYVANCFLCVRASIVEDIDKFKPHLHYCGNTAMCAAVKINLTQEKHRSYHG